MPTTQDTLPSLKKALAYRNDDIVYEFTLNYVATLRQSKELFEETKKWIWLCAVAKAKGAPEPIIHHELLALDYMWHQFVLFTREYHEYCHGLAASYIHHAPFC